MKKKRFLAILLAVVSSFAVATSSLTACGGGNNTDSTEQTGGNTSGGSSSDSGSTSGGSSSDSGSTSGGSSSDSGSSGGGSSSDSGSTSGGSSSDSGSSGGGSSSDSGSSGDGSSSDSGSSGGGSSSDSGSTSGGSSSDSGSTSGGSSSDSGSTSGGSSSDSGSTSGGSSSDSGSTSGGSSTTVTYTVTFISGGVTVSTQTVTSGGTVTSYTPASQDGKYFSGWYTTGALSTAFDFTTAITSDTTLYAKWVELNSNITYLQGNNESIAVEWSDTNASGATVMYKLASESIYHSIPASDIRAEDSTTLRADILGLKGGETYDIRIQTSGGTTINQSDVTVSAYDRSGYAHFNYTDGVGAYNDDGSLKDGALVIYLTESNKNDVSNDCYVYKATTQTYTQTDITQYLYCSESADVTLYGSGAMVGIGEILNNRRYSGSDRYNVGIAKLCEVYGSVAIRVIGTVSADVNSDGTATITGLTDYDSTGNGGSEGDNGRMARMVNAKNLTIEGVGEDAEIYGWGVHFIANDVLGEHSGAGKGFEVRNLTFESYPEDAIGMEGIQGSKYDETGSVTSGASSADADILSPVERCWIHNCSFLPGYCANPAESDKKEGDGSCDFKRGQYYTLSYCYFEYCHKTNLIGSSDASLQYNISMHHNYWYNCGSRIPLARRANIHFYNNYIYGDSTDSSASLSYVISARANSLVFAEANYFDGTKNPIKYEGGAVKAYNNTYYAATGENSATTVTSRTESISNSCAFTYKSIDYSSFDTNSSLFYYNSTTQTSDCYLTDAVTARRVVMQTAGVQKRSTDTVDTSMCTYKDKVTGAVNSEVESGGTLTVDLSKATAGGYVNNIYFLSKYSSGVVKGKGQVVTFTLTSEMDVTVAVSGTAETNLGELVSDDGTVYGSKFTSITVTLPAGTYFIGAGDKSKEVSITSLVFKDGTSDEQKVANVISLINSIGTVSLNSGDAITSARTAYDSLSSTLKAQVTNYATLTAAESAYSTLQVNNVISLINSIGTVSENSGSAISAARAAYSALSTTQQAQITNYSTLTAAETAYESYAVTAVQNAIDALPTVSTLTTQTALEEAQEEYEEAKDLYVALSEDQQAQITNYSKVTDGLTDIEQALKLYEFIEAVDALPSTITSSDASAMSAAVTLYNSLTSDQLSTLSTSYSSTLTKYETAYTQYTELMSKTTVAIFAKDVELPSNFTVTNGSYDSKTTFEYEGTSYNPLKIESSTEITVTVANDMTMTIYLSKASAKIKINGTDYTADSSGVVTVTLSAGTYTLTKNTSCNLYYIILTP